jgi:lysophospholipid acyltransferase (LPLAT)-like uncharacterized protein
MPRATALQPMGSHGRTWARVTRMRLPRNSRRYRVFLAVAGFAGALLLRLLGASWRVRFTGEDPFSREGPLVAATWHRGLLIAAYCFRDRGIVVPVSRSRDGDLASSLLRYLGFADTARGSSSKGATSLLRTLFRRARAGEPVAILSDGPRGPAGEAKSGVIAVARASGARLVPLGVSASPAKQFGSWDRAILPLPFARVTCRYGEPIQVPKKATGEALEALRSELEATLNRMNLQLDAELGFADRSRVARHED